MPRNGNGSYTLPPSNPVAPDTVIESDWANGTMSDLATAVTDSIAADGQTQPSANLPMNTFRHTNVGSPTLRNQYTNLGMVQDGLQQRVNVTSGVDNLLGTLIGGATAYVAGASVSFYAPGTNTGPMTLNYNGIGARNLTTNDGASLGAGQVVAGQFILALYNGTEFQMITASTGAAPDAIAAKGTTGSVRPAGGTYPLITIASPTTLNIPAGSAWIIPPGSGASQEVFWDAQVITLQYLTASFSTTITVGAGGIINQISGRAVGANLRNYAIIGVVEHLLGTADKVITSPMVFSDDTYRATDLGSLVSGYLVSGGLVDGNPVSLLQLDIAAGVIYFPGGSANTADGPNALLMPGQDNLPFRTLAGQNVVGGAVLVNAPVTQYDPNGTGVVTAIPNANDAVIHRIYYLYGVFIWVFGQTVYSTLTDALTRVEVDRTNYRPSLYIAGATLVAEIIATKGCTSLSSTTTAAIIAPGGINFSIGSSSGIGEAPIDGTPYGRQNAGWVPVVGVVSPDFTTDATITGPSPILEEVMSPVGAGTAGLQIKRGAFEWFHLDVVNPDDKAYFRSYNPVNGALRNTTTVDLPTGVWDFPVAPTVLGAPIAVGGGGAPGLWYKPPGQPVFMIAFGDSNCAGSNSLQTGLLAPNPRVFVRAMPTLTASYDVNALVWTVLNQDDPIRSAQNSDALVQSKTYTGQLLGGAYPPGYDSADQLQKESGVDVYLYQTAMGGIQTDGFLGTGIGWAVMNGAQNDSVNAAIAAMNLIITGDGHPPIVYADVIFCSLGANDISIASVTGSDWYNSRWSVIYQNLITAGWLNPDRTQYFHLENVNNQNANILARYTPGWVGYTLMDANTNEYVRLIGSKGAATISATDLHYLASQYVEFGQTIGLMAAQGPSGKAAVRPNTYISKLNPVFGGDADIANFSLSNVNKIAVNYGGAAVDLGIVDVRPPPFVGALINRAWTGNNSVAATGLDLPSLVKFAGLQTLNSNLSPFSANSLFTHSAILTNSPGVNRVYAAYSTVFYDGGILQDGGAGTTVGYASVVVQNNPLFQTLNAGTLTINTHLDLRSAMRVGVAGSGGQAKVLSRVAVEFIDTIVEGTPLGIVESQNIIRAGAFTTGTVRNVAFFQGADNERPLGNWISYSVSATHQSYHAGKVGLGLQPGNVALSVLANSWIGDAAFVSGLHTAVTGGNVVQAVSSRANAATLTGTYQLNAQSIVLKPTLAAGTLSLLFSADSSPAILISNSVLALKDSANGFRINVEDRLVNMFGSATGIILIAVDGVNDQIRMSNLPGVATSSGTLYKDASGFLKVSP